MFSRLIPLLLLLVSTNTFANKFPTEFIEYIDNDRIVAFIDESDIEKTSRWSPGESTVPPLSIKSALKAIHLYAEKDSMLSNATLRDIELKQIPRHKQYWHYLVKMEQQENAKSRSHYLIVLMNGKVLPGIREPEVIK